VDPATWARWFGYEQAFDHPFTLWVTLGIAAVLALAPAEFAALGWSGLASAELTAELWRRYRSWLALTLLVMAPILAGAFWTILGVAVLSLACYREFARATGLFRELFVSFVAVLGIVAVSFAVLDHWYALFQALPALAVAAIAALAILADRPQGYIQRVALAVFGFVLFGACLGHLGYIANDAQYRPILLFILVSVELNDVFAYIVGKSLGHHRLTPNTSPNKTLAGALGALVLTTLLVIVMGRLLFRGTELESFVLLGGLGIVISVVGQLGDLMLSSIKRDLGLKDMGATLPGHGGLLDRFDSLILTAPAAFHYIGYFIGFGLDQPERIITG
jgi:phosphatidate cytidylyltransferase